MSRASPSRSATGPLPVDACELVACGLYRRDFPSQQAQGSIASRDPQAEAGFNTGTRRRLRGIMRAECARIRTDDRSARAERAEARYARAASSATSPTRARARAARAAIARASARRRSEGPAGAKAKSPPAKPKRSAEAAKPTAAEAEAAARCAAATRRADSARVGEQQPGGLDDVAWAGVAVAAEAATIGVRLASRAIEAVRGNSERD